MSQDDRPDNTVSSAPLKRVFERAADYHPNFFPAEVGLDPQLYHQKKPAEYGGVKFFAEQGWIHGVHARAVPDAEGGIKVNIDHWVHRPDGNNVVTPFMEIKAIPALASGKPVIRIANVIVQGTEIDINDRKAVNSAMSTCQQVLEQLRLERRMPLLNKVASNAGLKTKPLPGTYKDGNARMAYESSQKNITRLLRIPQQFVPAVTAFFEEGYEATGSAPVLFSATARRLQQTMTTYTMYGEMQKLPVQDSTNVSLKLASKKPMGSEAYNEHDVVQLRFRPCTSAKNQGLVELASVSVDGRPQRVSDHKNMVRVLHLAHDAMLSVRHGVMPDLPEIISYTNTQNAMSGVPALTKEEGSRFTYRVLGGNPTGNRLSNQEGGIGANCFVYLYEWFDEKGDYKSDAFMVDCGLGKMDREKTGYDGLIPFAAAYFDHRFNPKHKPVHKVNTLMITHHHFDHYGGVAHLILAGYVVDHIITNEATKMFIEDSFNKLGVPKEWRPKQWTLVKEKQGLETKAGPFDLTIGWIPHSAITNWINVKTPKGSIFHFSDAKVDPNVKSHPAPDITKIQSLKPTMVTVDSTRAAQPDEAKSEQVVEQEMVDFMQRQHPDMAPLTFQIGSNAARITSVTDAYGRNGRDTVVFGASMQFLKKVMDKVKRRDGLGLKEHARSVFGRRVLNYTPNSVGANKIIKGPLSEQGLIATGTQNEMMSIANRLVENKDQKNLGFITPEKYYVILSQTGIGDNPTGWNQLKKWLERRGFRTEIIHASGHDGAKGIDKMLGWVGAPYGAVTHGSVEQRKPAEDIVTNRGMAVINPSEQDVIEVSDEKGCTVIGQEPSTMIYYTTKVPDGQYWSKGVDVEYYAHVSHPEIRSSLGTMMHDMSRVLPEASGVNLRARQVQMAQPQQDPVLNLSGVNLNRKQKRVQISLPDYLIRNGFMRHVIYDTETTMLGRYAWITEFAAKQKDWADPTKTKRTNFYQILPETIIPDLDALLATGNKPSDLYKTGENRFPPRQFYNEITKFLQDSKRIQIDEEHYTDRIWIDGAKKPKDPSRRDAHTKSKGNAAYLERSLDFSLTKEGTADFKTPRLVKVKTAIEGFNNKRADDPWMQHAAYRAGDLRYSPMNTDGIRSMDIRNKARLFAYLRPDKFKVNTKPDSPQFLDFTVEGIMKANNLGYEKEGKAHRGTTDVEMEDEINDFMLSIDPELFTQMTINADPSEVKSYLAGTHNGMLYPRQLLTYINTLALDAKANIGVYVGRSTDRRYMNRAVLFNVSDFDPKDFLNMSPQEISEIMSDSKHPMHRAFEIISINKQPLLASADRGIAVGANRGTSLETMKGYKHFIERHPQVAANMVKAMEIARALPDHDHRMPLEERIFAPEFMEMSAHDKALAKKFIPVDEEFTDEDYAHTLNLERAAALDQFHNNHVRERYVAVMYQVERETALRLGERRDYLHPTDRAREKAREKARVQGVLSSDAMSIGRLEAQIDTVTKNWDTRMAGKTDQEKDLAQTIVQECRDFVDTIKDKIRAGDPEWALTPDDYALLGLNDNINYGIYKTPLAVNPNIPEPKVS